jgi:hypothetical protein
MSLPPTDAELDAAEIVLAEANNSPVDGYWRSIGCAVLEAAKDASMREFQDIIDQEFEADLGDSRR